MICLNEMLISIYFLIVAVCFYPLNIGKNTYLPSIIPD